MKKENNSNNSSAIVPMADGEPAITLRDLTNKMADFAMERDWDQFHSPRNLLLALVCLFLASLLISSALMVFLGFFFKVGEVGELSEIFQWRGEVPRGLPGWDEKEKEHLGEELSDVLLYLVRLADICGVDLGVAALRKMEINARKYPVQYCKGSSKKRDHYSSENPTEEL
ncbi:dCTP diphosphatase protein [Dioscorea alata]|uniref:dCTP diphosphatase protein n=1 Tax=Dioscorea alata TaxID=55571 RepID=A0ACB7VA26_DIOAL|nr:dCTP diphosphatase protein [Dioscorea alata]